MAKIEIEVTVYSGVKKYSDEVLTGLIAYYPETKGLSSEKESLHIIGEDSIPHPHVSNQVRPETVKMIGTKKLEVGYED